MTGAQLPTPRTEPSIGFGAAAVRIPGPPTAGAHAVPFPALGGLTGLAMPFVLAFALRADLARLEVPAPVQHLADGGFVLVDLFLVLIGFHLCRPLTAVLTGSGSDALGLATALLRRIGPLHLTAWTITFGWFLSGGSTASAWSWVSSALLLNGVTGPQRAGYPVSWSVSVALVAVVLLIVAAFALTHRPGRTRASRGRAGLVRFAVPQPGRLVTWIAVSAAATGTALLLTGIGEAGTAGPSAIGQALLGLGCGILCFRMLEASTGTFKPPLPNTAPARRTAPGLGALLTLGVLLFCVYRSDLAHELALLPAFVVSAVLVFLLASPQHAMRSPVHRLLGGRLPQWLGTRALALYLLHGPVQLSVERVCAQLGLERTSTPAVCAVLVAVVLLSPVAAELGHRHLEKLLVPTPEPAKPELPETISLSRLRSRPERVQQIDQQAIPTELRLKPLPKKTSH